VEGRDGRAVRGARCGVSCVSNVHRPFPVVAVISLIRIQRAQRPRQDHGTSFTGKRSRSAADNAEQPPSRASEPTNPNSSSTCALGVDYAKCDDGIKVPANIPRVYANNEYQVSRPQRSRPQQGTNAGRRRYGGRQWRRPIITTSPMREVHGNVFNATISTSARRRPRPPIKKAIYSERDRQARRRTEPIRVAAWHSRTVARAGGQRHRNSTRTERRCRTGGTTSTAQATANNGEQCRNVRGG